MELYIIPVLFDWRQNFVHTALSLRRLLNQFRLWSSTRKKNKMPFYSSQRFCLSNIGALLMQSTNQLWYWGMYKDYPRIHKQACSSQFWENRRKRRCRAICVEKEASGVEEGEGCAQEGKGGAEQFLTFNHVIFYPGFYFTVFVFKISFAVVYLHTIWTFTLKGRSSVASASYIWMDCSTRGIYKPCCFWFSANWFQFEVDS
jgi:hypothetical protein